MNRELIEQVKSSAKAHELTGNGDSPHAKMLLDVAVALEAMEWRDIDDPDNPPPKDGTPFAAVGIVGQRIDPWPTVYTCAWSEEDQLWAAWCCPDWLHIDATKWTPLPLPDAPDSGVAG